MNLFRRFFNWLSGKRTLELPAHEIQCSAIIDDEGYCRCEGRTDPDCIGKQCLTHCRKLCGDRCTKAREQREAVSGAQMGIRKLVRCSSQQYPSSSYRCEGVEDPRCSGRNCTMHCREFCGSACLPRRLRSA